MWSSMWWWSVGWIHSDESAARVANHDLKSLIHVLDCWEPGIHLPLMALVDYRGYRVICMSLLPITQNTLVHGSADAGKTVRHSESVQRKLRKVAQALNLREHRVCNDPNKQFDTPVDLEAHAGTDGRLYLVDFGRLFPPQDPRVLFEGRNRHLYQLLRPEFVARYPCPLCSDAFSSFLDRGGAEQAREINKDIEEATRALCEQVVPAFAKKLVEIPPALRDEVPLVLTMHEHGINTRFLGLVYQHVDEHHHDDNWLVRIFAEMVARAVKNEVRRQWRNAQLGRDLQCLSVDKRIAATCLNNVLGFSAEADVFWAAVLRPALERKYPPFAYRGPEPLLRWMVRKSAAVGLPDVRCAILREVTRVLGIRLIQATWDELARRADGFGRAQPLTSTDIVDLVARTKEMNLANHAAGFVLKIRAKRARAAHEKQRLLALATEQFTRALHGNPTNRTTLRNIGECLAALGREAEARAVFVRAVANDPSDTITWYKYATVLVKQGRFDEAEECFLRSLEECPVHSNCCYYYADFLAHIRKDFAEAEHFYRRALRIDPANAAAANNYAVFLTTVARDVAKADRLFRVATTAPTNPQIVANYAAFLYYIRHDPEAAHALLRSHHLLFERSRTTITTSNNSTSPWL